MRLAVNYSLELARLITEGAASVDLVKCGLAGHGGGRGPAGPLLRPFLAAPGRWQHRRGRLGARGRSSRPHADAAGQLPHLPAVRPLPVARRRCRRRRDAHPGHRGAAAQPRHADRAVRAGACDGREPLLVPEGQPPADAMCDEPRGHRRAGRAASYGFVLDLSHARIAARQLGVDERGYVSSLPVGQLRELHVSGIGEVGGQLTDHLPLAEEDWAALDWAMEQIRAAWGRPQIVAFEYGGIGEPFKWRSEYTVLADQVPRLKGMIGR